MQIKCEEIRTNPSRVTKPMWATRMIDRLMSMITAGAAVGMLGLLVVVAARGL